MLEALRVTLLVASLATVLVLAPAIATGFVLARRSFAGKSVVETLGRDAARAAADGDRFLLLRLFAQHGRSDARRWASIRTSCFTWRARCSLARDVVPLVARTARVAFEGFRIALETMGESLGWSRGARVDSHHAAARAQRTARGGACSASARAWESSARP
jgi:ABC-type molybdate transport system permease subunit